ncbi:oxysterol-binding protein-related protein 3 isoform X2 [Brienomyrus brachyistius]|uniref:oxysterol-binding protein-related protein 3 isoform X2 n=1 Tax=Brienomyrus brachyistius TaxID=42636 RepID=UPI0020B34E38|nr:oxysterol-binding protein-related protein 3 isoform X2 [Brienomyrus brachyistius]
MISEEKASFMAQKMSSPSRSNSSGSSKHDSRQDSWEIIDGHRGESSNGQEPLRQEGYLLKRRKWPLKGWHKRYFLLDKGILKYAKSGADIEKGKLHGCIDVGRSVMAIKKNGKCIDLDAEDNIYHLKINTQEVFDEWVSKLRDHRLYRQTAMAVFPHDKPLFFPHFAPASPNLSEKASIRKTSIPHEASMPLAFSSQAKVTAWLQSSEDMDRCTKELSLCESYLLELHHLLKSMEVLHRTYSAPAINALQATLDSPKKEKRASRKWRTKNFGKDNKTTLQVPSCISSSSLRLHSSNPNLSSVEPGLDKADPEALDSPPDAAKLQEDFCRVADTLHAALKSAFSTLSAEREKLKQVLDQETPSTQVLGLKSTLASKQDSTDEPHLLVHQVSNESRASISESLSEFFDAREVLRSASSSENEGSDDDSYISDVSDNLSVENLSNGPEGERPNPGLPRSSGRRLRAATSESIFSDSAGAREICGAAPHEDEADVCSVAPARMENGAPHRQRRSRLPAPSPNTSNISLWNILKNNIGKDLSKVAMPVALNEPLNTLQRLCEELEYSELLDQAAAASDPFDRMVYIATFAISGYAASYYRAAGKPFNPVLGETYECDRPDKGFRFIAEQVSHHPPISACHADSKNFTFWQDMRWKNKFWGKSMEIVPVGATHVVLLASGDHYEWDKVTSCIHNIMSGQRWIEHYGEITIKNHTSDACRCKVTFLKAKYWNSSVNDVEGLVTDSKGNVIRKLYGKWHEGIYCGEPPSATCIWRTYAMPADYEQYYGFTTFAIELNELDPETKALFPPTDSRLRLDQRLLEDGNVEAAEEQKQRIEQLQRDRRKVLEENNMTHQPRFFKKLKDDTWVSNNTYWDLRKDPGFASLDWPVLW